MYKYDNIKDSLFTEKNQRLFVAVRDRVKALLATTGAITMGQAMQLPDGIGCADSWTLMACVDRLVELGELTEVHRENVPGQCRVFVLT